MAKQDYNWIFYVAIIAILFFGGRAGWFGAGFTNVFGGGAFVDPDPQQQLYSYNVIITLTPNPVCVGSDVRGTISSNMPNGVCSIFTNAGEGWNLLLNANLDQSGYFTATQTLEVVGSTNVRAVCCDAEGNCRISNVITLISQMCGGNGPDDGGDEAYGATCDTKCKGAGFVAGDGFASLIPSQCTGEWVYTELTGSKCCCLPFGGDAPAAQCDSSYCVGLGYATGSTLSPGLTCSQYSGSQCSSMGSTVAAYVLYSQNNCCCWTCNAPSAPPQPYNCCVYGIDRYCMPVCYLPYINAQTFVSSASCEAGCPNVMVN